MPPKGSKKRKAKGAAGGELTAHEGGAPGATTRSKRAKQPSVTIIEEEDGVQQTTSDNESEDEDYEPVASPAIRVPVVNEPRTPQHSSEVHRQNTISQRPIPLPVSGPGLLRWPQLCERCVQYMDKGNTCDATAPGPFHRKCSRCVKGKAYCIPIEDPALIIHANSAIRGYEQLVALERLGHDTATAQAHFDTQHGILQGNLRMFQQHRRNRVGDVATPHRRAAGITQGGGQSAQALALTTQRLSTGLESLVDMIHGYLLSSALERNSEHQAPLRDALARTTVRHRRWDGDVASATLEDLTRVESPTAPSHVGGVRSPVCSRLGAEAPSPDAGGVHVSGGFAASEEDKDEDVTVDD